LARRWACAPLSLLTGGNGNRDAGAVVAVRQGDGARKDEEATVHGVPTLVPAVAADGGDPADLRPGVSEAAPATTCSPETLA
jgi:hypothetical protein